MEKNPCPDFGEDRRGVNVDECCQVKTPGVEVGHSFPIEKNAQLLFLPITKHKVNFFPHQL
jgi:hypothetical protein